MALPMLEFAATRGMNVTQAKLDLLRSTRMCDFEREVYIELNGDALEATDEMKRKREMVIETHAKLGALAANGVKFAADGAAVKLLRRDKTHNAHFAKENHGVDVEDVDALFKYAKFEYECGDYASASEHLGVVQMLSVDAARSEKALWGKFAADILLRNWSGALDDMNRLRDAIENNTTTSALAKMKQRAWLLHWSLFVFFNHQNGRNLIIDIFFQERYMQAAQQEAPYLLRYLTVSVVTNKKRRSMLKDLVRTIQSDTYRDPVIDFVLALFVEYDFNKAQDKLKTCEELIENDFFLIGCKTAFAECARMHVIENYCKVNKHIDIASLAGRLNMSADDAEAMIINLIRINKLNAKIDSEAGMVIVQTEIKSVNEQIIEKTKALLSKTKALTQAVLANTQAQAY
jgi:translation initiation factor 3 subunit E